MNKEELYEYKLFLDSLSNEEKAKRNEYLKKISSGEIHGPSTGYSSIDRPNLKYYREEPIRNIEKYDNIYDLIFEEKNMDKEIIGFLDGKCNWTYKKLKKATDSLVDSFSKEGISIGDNVLCGVTNTPEFVAAFIALVCIGAVVKLFDIRASEKDIIAYANSSRCQYAIALNNIVAPKIKNIINETFIKKVYVMNPANSLSTIEKLVFVKNNFFVGGGKTQKTY